MSSMDYVFRFGARSYRKIGMVENIIEHFCRYFIILCIRGLFSNLFSYVACSIYDYECILHMYAS